MSQTFAEQRKVLQDSLVRIFPTELPSNLDGAANSNIILTMRIPWDKVVLRGENDSRLAEEFDELPFEEQLYYLPCYLSYSLEGPFYQRHLIDILLTTRLAERLTAAQIGWLQQFISLLRTEISLLRGLERWSTEISVRDLERVDSRLMEIVVARQREM
jgi:hypothetical protein